MDITSHELADLRDRWNRVFGADLTDDEARAVVRQFFDLYEALAAVDSEGETAPASTNE